MAPLAVFFDTASSTMASTTDYAVTQRPFHDLGYRWDFNDPTAGVWTYGTASSSKNVAYGPLAAHVFETPGTYTVTMYVTDNGTSEVSTTTTITVTDPNTVFSGTNTICFYNTALGTGCPAGATQVATSTSDSAINMYNATGKRLLFKRGDTFTATTYTIVNHTGPGIIGAYGTGTNPLLLATTGTSLIQLSSQYTPGISDWRIMDLELSGGSTLSNGIFAQGGINQVTALRIYAHNLQSPFQFSADILNFWNANGSPGHTLYDQIFIQDSQTSGVTGVAGSLSFFGSATQLALIGNSFDNSHGGEHTVRINMARNVVISHNNIQGAGTGGKSTITIRAVLHGGSPTNVEQGRDTQFVVVSDNKNTGTSDATDLIALEPQQSEDARDVDVIIERNYLIANGGSTGITTAGINSRSYSSVTIRNNIIDMTGASVGFGILVKRYSTTVYPTLNWIYNNTIYSSSPGAVFDMVDVDSQTTNITVKNNLGYAPNDTLHNGATCNGSNTLTSCTTAGSVYSNNSLTTTSSGNGVLVSPKFINTSGATSTPSDFQLQNTSYATSTGANSILGVFTDFANTSRLVTVGGQTITSLGAYQADFALPVISAVATSSTNTTATITWTTDKASNSKVFYGLTSTYSTSIATDTPMVTSHSETLTGLTPGTTYHFKVASNDSALNYASSTDYYVNTTGINPLFIPSRTTGVAPLAVFFDTASTSASTTAASYTSRPFHDLDYAWDFGDTSAGVWTYGTASSSKNAAYGPEAAHVFENPGTYTVTMTVFDGTNTVSTTTTITVTDPDTIFSGTNTICVSATAAPVAGIDGCPTSASVFENSDFANSIATYLDTGKRVLFKGGETFTSTGKATLNKNGPWSIGAYGTGKARVISTYSGSTDTPFLETAATGATLSDGRIMDLELDGESYAKRKGIRNAAGFDQLTLLRLHIHHTGFMIQAILDNYDGLNSSFNTPYHVWDQFALVDSEINNPVRNLDGTNGGSPLFLAVERLAYMGNNVHDMQSGTHPTRLEYASRFVISNNFIADAPKQSDPHGSSLESLKISTPNNIPGSDYFVNLTGTTKHTQFGVLGENEFRVRGDSAMASGPAQCNIDTVVALLEDVIFERNRIYFEANSNQDTMIRNGIYNVTYRNNIFDASNTSNNAVQPITLGLSSCNPSANIDVSSNTFFTGRINPALVFRGVFFATPNNVGDVRAVNNVVYSPNAHNPYGLQSVAGTPSAGTLTVSYNTVSPLTDNPLFASTTLSYSLPQDFMLQAGSYAIGTTTTRVPGVFRDFFGTLRPTHPSLGAVDLNAPYLSAGSNSSVTTNSASVSGTLSATGGQASTDSGFTYSSTDATASTGTTVSSGAVGLGTFSATLSSLLSNTLYYARPYATNAIGTGYGPIFSFTTSAAPGQTPAAAATQSTPAGSISPVITGTYHPDSFLNPTASSSASAPTPASTPTSSPTIPLGLKQGSTGTNVTSLQSFLESKGFLTMPANTPKGIFGSLTKAALMKYQQSQGLEQTGAIGPKTQAAIAGQGATPNTPTTSAPSAPASATASSTTVPTKNLQLRDSGPQVSALQSLLGVTPTTGYFGLATYQALVKYQKAHNLPATGFYGPVTRATMQTK